MYLGVGRRAAKYFKGIHKCSKADGAQHQKVIHDLDQDPRAAALMQCFKERSQSDVASWELPPATPRSMASRWMG